VETMSATSGGRKTHVFTPDAGNSMYRLSMEGKYSIK
jgi:hypothetical protein